MSRIAVRAGLDARDREKAWISRRLHDEIGPALCAAGLQLSLLENRLQGGPPDISDSLGGLRSALDTSMEEIRTLSYLCDPILVERIGLDSAVGYLSRALGCNPPPASPEPRSDGAASRAYILLQAAALEWRWRRPSAGFEIDVDENTVTLECDDPAPATVREMLESHSAKLGNGGRRLVIRLDGEEGRHDRYSSGR